MTLPSRIDSADISFFLKRTRLGTGDSTILCRPAYYRGWVTASSINRSIVSLEFREKSNQRRSCLLDLCERSSLHTQPTR
jgi:hypothetical protein